MRTDKPASWTVTIVWLALIALAVFALAALLLLYVPGQKRTFDEFGLQLPTATQAIIRLAAFASNYWWLLVPALLAVCCGVPLVIRHVARAATLGTAFAAVFLTGLLAANILTVYAIAAPMAALTRGLSK